MCYGSITSLQYHLFLIFTFSILRAIAKSVAIVPGIENTLIIIIQKLIVSVERSTSALRIQNSFNYALQMRNSTISCQYRPVTISVMILQHFLWRGSPQLSSNDQQTFLRLLQRSLYNFNDSALVLTLDTFIGYIKLYKKRLKQSNQAENDLPTFEKQVFACLDHVYKTHQIFKRFDTIFPTTVS